LTGIELTTGTSIADRQKSQHLTSKGFSNFFNFNCMYFVSMPYKIHQNFAIPAPQGFLLVLHFEFAKK